MTHGGECPQCEKMLSAYPDFEFECICCRCSFSNFMYVYVIHICVCVYIYAPEIPVIDSDTFLKESKSP